MNEKSYLVYEPTPLGEGIPIALFSSLELAMVFVQAYMEKYVYQAHLSIKKVDVNDKNNLHSHMHQSEPMGDPYEEPFSTEMGD